MLTDAVRFNAFVLVTCSEGHFKTKKKGKKKWDVSLFIFEMFGEKGFDLDH